MSGTVRPYLGRRPLETVLGGGVWPSRSSTPPARKRDPQLDSQCARRHAGGGRLTIETATRYMTEKYAPSTRLTAGQYVLLAVTDNGAGMPEKSWQSI